MQDEKQHVQKDSYCNQNIRNELTLKLEWAEQKLGETAIQNINKNELKNIYIKES